jgi:hypothetical protein
MDNVEGGLAHLAAADTAFAAVSRAPLAKIEAFKARMGWRFPWVSSGESDFNYDFHVTLDEARGSEEYNYESVAELRRRGEVPQAASDMPGFSVFLRDGDDVYHTYSTYQRGVDVFLNTYNLLGPHARGPRRGAAEFLVLPPCERAHCDTLCPAPIDLARNVEVDARTLHPSAPRIIMRLRTVVALAAVAALAACSRSLTAPSDEISIRKPRGEEITIPNPNRAPGIAAPRFDDVTIPKP